MESFAYNILIFYMLKIVRKKAWVSGLGKWWSREFHVVWPRNQGFVKVSVPFQIQRQ